MTLTEFLLARIADDEECAHHGDGGLMDHEDGARFDRSRVLAECEAKRRIVALHETVRATPGRDQWTCAECGSTTHPCATLRALAAIHADHPDYDESWRP